MFVCPECGGDRFGTNLNINEGHCNGGSHGQRCGYRWKRSKENDAKVFKPDYDQLEERIVELEELVLQTEQQRVTAQLSGLETGWEHPSTRVMWTRLVKRAVTP